MAVKCSKCQFENLEGMQFCGNLLPHMIRSGQQCRKSADRRPKSAYIMMCVPFEIPTHSMVATYIIEEDSMETVAARVYPVILAGASVNTIPLMEFSPGGAAKIEKRLGG